MNKEKVISVVKEILSYTLIIAFVLLFKTYVFTLVRVDGTSMNNTLDNKDILLLNEFDKTYNRFDIVVFDNGNDKLIKRVIGLPGETVELKDNILYINDKKIEQDFLDEENLNTTTGTLAKTYVPKGYYFVMGDNRRNSFDSRYFGAIKKEKIMGKIALRVYPFKQIEG